MPTEQIIEVVKTRPNKYGIDKMENHTELFLECTPKVRNRICVSVHVYAHRYGRKFVTEKCKVEGKKGIRIYRIK